MVRLRTDAVEDIIFLSGLFRFNLILIAILIQQRHKGDNRHTGKFQRNIHLLPRFGLDGHIGSRQAFRIVTFRIIPLQLMPDMVNHIRMQGVELQVAPLAFVNGRERFDPGQFASRGNMIIITRRIIISIPPQLYVQRGIGGIILNGQCVRPHQDGILQLFPSLQMAGRYAVQKISAFGLLRLRFETLQIELTKRLANLFPVDRSTEVQQRRLALLRHLPHQADPRVLLLKEVQAYLCYPIGVITYIQFIRDVREVAKHSGHAAAQFHLHDNQIVGHEVERPPTGEKLRMGDVGMAVSD